MGWMQKLCEAYDVGIVSDQSREQIPLVPVGFFREREIVAYHVILSRDREFVSANELSMERNESDEKGFVVPSTAERESYTGESGALRPLVTKLKYLVDSEATSKWFTQYMTLLRDWIEQEGTPECLCKVYCYLNGRTLLEDLESQGNIKVNYYKDKEKREGFGSDANKLVCFSVQMPDDSRDDLWERADVKESWSRYYAATLSKGQESGFCYVEGKKLPLIKVHPRVEGLGSPKLIPERDDQEFPVEYKGRFVDSRSAAQISVDASVRAHHALAWLIARQGVKNMYGMTWVVWNTNGAVMHVPVADLNDLSEVEDEDEEEDEYETGKPTLDTFDGYAEAVKDAARGYGCRLKGWDAEKVNYVCILGLKAPIPGKGNLAITYYQELFGNDYVKRLTDWYQNCCWWGRYNSKTETMEITTPIPTKIAIAVMGSEAVKIAQGKKKRGPKDTDPPERKLMRRVLSQLMTCIVDKQPLPWNMVQSAFHRCCNPLSFTGGRDKKWDRYAWNTSVNTTCAMILCFQMRRNAYDGEVFPPELQTASRNRDYLYGRLFAVADVMEAEEMKRQAKRSGRPDQAHLPTNAIRLMQKFVQRPFETWRTIHEKLIPVFQSVGKEAKRYQIAFEEIEGLFIEEQRLSKGSLSLEFLQGYSSQQQAWYTKRDKEEPDSGKPKEAVPYRVPTSRSQLYGCLLAIADKVELEASDGERIGETNAMQMMPVFAARPYESWGRLHDKLIPYLEKLGEDADYYQYLIGMVEAQFSISDREVSAPLDSSYLHGYYGMLQTFYRKTQYCWQPQARQESGEDMRSIWYGQMLGAAERLERRAMLIKSDKATEDAEQRVTNALRYMTAFAQKPADTWEYLKIKLKPYLRYGAERTAASELLEQLEAQLEQHGWNTNVPLSSIYLHGYYAERINKGE